MMTLKEAKIRATELEISGRSKMNKAELLEAISIAEKAAEKAPEVASVESVKAPIMNNFLRMDIYTAQNGGRKITPRQGRRINKAANRILKRGGIFDRFPEARTESGKRKAAKANG